MITTLVFAGLAAFAAIGWLAFLYFAHRESQWTHEEQTIPLEQR